MTQSVSCVYSIIQCHFCWWRGNASSRGIGSHGINFSLRALPYHKKRGVQFPRCNWTQMGMVKINNGVTFIAKIYAIVLKYYTFNSRIYISKYSSWNLKVDIIRWPLIFFTFLSIHCDWGMLVDDGNCIIIYYFVIILTALLNLHSFVNRCHSTWMV